MERKSILSITATLVVFIFAGFAVGAGCRFSFRMSGGKSQGMFVRSGRVSEVALVPGYAGDDILSAYYADQFAL